MDLLQLPMAGDQALREALEANLIVFADPCGLGLPSWLTQWLECWAKCRQVEDAALALMHDGPVANHLAPTIRTLSRLATRYGLGLITANETAGGEETGSVVRSPAEHARSLDAMAISIRSAERGWGIND
jgi:hypothetical protein